MTQPASEGAELDNGMQNLELADESASARDAKRAEANRKKRERAKKKKAEAAAAVADDSPAGRWQRGVLPGGHAERREAGSNRGMGVFAVEDMPKGQIIAEAPPALSVIFDSTADLTCSFCFAQPEKDGTTEVSVTLKTGDAGFGIVLDDLILAGTSEPCTVITRVTSESPNRSSVRVGDRIASIDGKEVKGGHAVAIPLLRAAVGSAEAAGVAVVLKRPKLIQCQGCKKVAVCDECVAAGHLQWHNFECAVYQTLPQGALGGETATLRMLLRYKISTDPKGAGEWSASKEPSALLASLQGNACDVPPDQLSALARMTGLSNATTASIIYQVRTNACEVSRGGGKVGCALSVLMGWHNHDCLPAAAATVEENGRVTLTALRDISEGEEVTISYVDPSKPYDERRQTLAAHYGFECRCERCTSEQRRELKQRMKEREIYMSGQRR